MSLVMAVVMVGVEDVVLIRRVGITSPHAIPRRGVMVSSSRGKGFVQAALAAAVAARRVRLGQASAIARPLSVGTGGLVFLF